MRMFLTLLISMLLFTLTAFAQEVVVVPGESFVDSMIKFLASPTGSIMAVGAVEFLLRFVKSEKSLGIFQLVGRGLVVFGKGAVVLGEFLDKVLGQRKKAGL